MTPTLYALTTLLNPWRTIRRLEAENQRLDAQAAMLHSLATTALAKNAAYERSRLHRCRAHGQQLPNVWGCPECVRELRQGLDDAEEQLATAKEALWRLQRWGGWPLSPVASWDVDTTVAIADWLQRGMTGPLPPLPEHLTQRKGKPDAEQGL